MTPRIWRPPRLRAVAERAGVSLATASRVLSGNRVVTAAAQEAVLAAVRDLGYQNPGADSPGGVAILATAIDRIGYSDTLTGIIEAARDEHLLVEIHIADTSTAALSEQLIGQVLARPLVGVILLDFDSVARDLIARLPAQVPVAIAGGTMPVEGRAHCQIDDFSAARAATEYLMGLGHRTIAYLGVPQSGHPEPRGQGWRTALEEAGLAITPGLGIGWSAERGRRAAEQIADGLEITAVLCGNDELAIGLIAGLTALGISVPEEVSVIGFDDHPLAAHTQPPLSTVRQDFVELGRDTLRLLVSLATDGIVRQRIVPTELVRRASTGPAPEVLRLPRVHLE